MEYTAEKLQQILDTDPNKYKAFNRNNIAQLTTLIYLMRNCNLKLFSNGDSIYYIIDNFYIVDDKELRFTDISIRFLNDRVSMRVEYAGFLIKQINFYEYILAGYMLELISQFGEDIRKYITIVNRYFDVWNVFQKEVKELEGELYNE